MNRYIAMDGAEGHPCCYGASVWDTKNKDNFGDPLVICECQDLPMAERIAKGLNLLEKPN